MQLGDRARAGRRRLPRVLDALRRDRRGRSLRPPAAGRRLEPDGGRLRLRRRGRRADGGADVGRARAARRDAVHRDVRDGLRDRLDPDVAHGRGQLAARSSGSPGAADQAPARDRRARRPADVPVPVRARARDAGHARRARRRALPAGGQRGRGARARRAAEARDAVRVLQAERRRARVHERLAAARRPAPPGPEPRPRRRGRGRSSASSPGSRSPQSPRDGHRPDRHAGYGRYPWGDYSARESAGTVAECASSSPPSPSR